MTFCPHVAPLCDVCFENGVPDHVLQSRQLQIRRKVAFEVSLEKTGEEWFVC